MTSEIQVHDGQGRPVPGQGETPLASAIARWQGLPIEVREFNGTADFGPVHIPFPTVGVCVGGRGGQVDLVVGRRPSRLPFRAGVCAIHEQDLEIDHSIVSGARARVVAVQIPPDLLRRLMPDTRDALRLHTHLPAEDATLVALVGEMHAELQRDCSAGRLFAQGLTMSFIGYLKSRYGLQAEQVRAPGKLSRVQLRRVVDFIDQNLAKDIGIDELAALLGFSPAHFSRVFKASMGTSPYRFVQDLRIDKALAMMQGTASLAEIAQAVGLSNQSHFTQVFRRKVGVPPARWRGQ